jgi:hypothetical protein
MIDRIADYFCFIPFRKFIRDHLLCQVIIANNIMSGELIILLATTASIAVIHTHTGTDHYLPFIVISRVKNRL